MFLFKQVTIVDAQSPHHLQIRDLLWQEGKIEKIALHLSDYPETATVIEAEGAHLSPAWTDLGAFVGEPGLEQKEDFASLAAAARRGGFGTVLCYPNSRPVVDNQTAVRNILQQQESVDFLPMGALSVGAKGQDLAELIDMHQAGALAFGDGLHSVQQSGMLLRALRYVKAFDGLVVNQAYQQDLVHEGQMHEGRMSTLLGLSGIPALAEHLMVHRDIELAAYTASRLHLSNISSAESVALIRRAKERGLAVTASVNPVNLAFTDALLKDFQSEYKVLPPIRDEWHRQALIEGLVDGTIDAIQSNHQSCEPEEKHCEFLYARFGATSLEATFAASWTALKDHLSISDFLNLLSQHPRRILGLEQPCIEEGAELKLSCFQPEQMWVCSKNDLRAKGKNSPFVGHTFTGRVLDWQA